MLNLLKCFIYALLSKLPGKIGLNFETRLLWTRRGLSYAKTQAAFEDKLNSLTDSSICLDLGANVGVISKLLAERAGHVHCFEPDPWAFEKLRQCLDGFDNVTLHNAAVGNRDGTLTMRRDPAFNPNTAAHRTQGTSAYASLLWGDGTSDTFTVTLVDIRRVLREIGAPVDIVKMDIEGSEVDVLECLLPSPELSMVRTMFVETHEPQMPELRGHLRRLRKQVSNIQDPIINLDWH